MKSHPVLRAEALSVILAMLAGAIGVVYTFSTTYATNAKVDRVEDTLRGDLKEFRLEMLKRFDKTDNKIDSIER